jgi:hypothetical protein
MIVVHGSSDQLFDLTVFGKPAETFLGKYQPLIDLDFIHPTGGGDQLDSGIIFFLELSFQPGSTRFIVSRRAILYGNSHHFLLDSPTTQNDPGCILQRALL